MLIQSLLGVEFGLVMISMISPFLSSYLSGTRLAVHLGAGAGMPHFGVDGIGEIERGGAARESLDVALRGEHVHLVRDTDPRRRFSRKSTRVLQIAHPVEQRLEPGEALPFLFAPCRRLPYNASAPRCRLRPPDPFPRCGSGFPCAGRYGPSTVVCSDWYILDLGMAM